MQHFAYLVEVRRVELLSKKPSIPVSPSAVYSRSSLGYFKQTRKYSQYPLITHYSQGKKQVRFLHNLRPILKRRDSRQNDAALRQRMLILYYQRLFLIAYLFKVELGKLPLLASNISSFLSKPLHPHKVYYSSILYLIEVFNIIIC